VNKRWPPLINGSPHAQTHRSMRAGRRSQQGPSPGEKTLRTLLAKVYEGQIVAGKAICTAGSVQVRTLHKDFRFVQSAQYASCNAFLD